MNCKVSPRNYRNTLVDASRHTHQTLYYEGPRGKAELKVTEVVTSSKLKGVELTESHHVEAYRSMDQCFCPKKRKELVLFGECECRGSLLNFLESRPVKLSVSSENRKYKGSKARLLVESTSSGIVVFSSTFLPNSAECRSACFSARNNTDCQTRNRL